MKTKNCCDANFLPLAITSDAANDDKVDIMKMSGFKKTCKMQIKSDIFQHNSARLTNYISQMP